jgi:hypothetical protein
MVATPHFDKLVAAVSNPKCAKDVSLLEEAIELYKKWTHNLDALEGKGKDRVTKMVKLLNQYKDDFEVELVMKRGTPLLRRQKGQLKLDNSILEEFLVRLVHPDIIEGIGDTQFVVGPQNAFLSLSFRPRSFSSLGKRPEVVLKTKDQDFVIGTEIHYKLAPNSAFAPKNTEEGSFILAIVAAECKINLDKTMFQEAAGTASRLKMGCPVAKYFLLVEYLDMEPEDPRLTDIDNVFLLRRAKRLPFGKRYSVKEVTWQHKSFPIDADIVWGFAQQIQAFVEVAWYDPVEALRRGTFI